jgi:hypothetical protein
LAAVGASAAQNLGVSLNVFEGANRAAFFENGAGARVRQQAPPPEDAIAIVGLAVEILPTLAVFR